MKTLETKNAPAAIGPYSQAKMVNNFVFASGQIPVEYKKSAVMGDIIYPKMAVEEQRKIVELCDAEGNPYAVVEFKEK